MRRILVIVLIATAVLVLAVFAKRSFMPKVNLSLPNLPRFVTSNENPFGVMFANKSLVPAASSLGARYYRPNSVFIEGWSGECDECAAALKENLKLVLTVRNNGGRGQPTTPPKDIPLFKSTLSKILEKYKPALLAVENEENSQSLFYDGTVDEYLQELTAGCEVAHLQNIKCTNGGLVSSLVALLVANDYREQGDEARAKSYLERTLGNKLSDFGDIDTENVFDDIKVRQQIEKGKSLLPGYKKSGADYVNFHWYIADTEALAEAVNYLEKTTKLKAVTNEVGQQKNENPQQVTKVMEEIVKQKLPIAVWFSVDVTGFGGARSLVDKSTGNLRPNGEAFRDFITKNFAN